MKYIYNTMIRIILLSLLVFSIATGIKGCVSDKTEIKRKENQIKLDSLQKIVDSLSNEVFIHKTNVDRYEIAVGILKERDSISAQKFEDILYKEIE